MKSDVYDNESLVTLEALLNQLKEKYYLKLEELDKEILEVMVNENGNKEKSGEETETSDAVCS